MNRRFFSFFISFIMVCSSLFATPLPDLFSDGAVLIEPKTNTVLFAKNAKQTFYPASTTKLLTSLIVLEDLPTNALVTKTQDAVNHVPSDSSHVGLAVGDQYTVFDGLHAVLLGSDNFVCYDLAVKDTGSIEAFAEKMNSKAKSLGAVSSHFVNPHGYHDPDHYTTPFDLSQIARGAFSNSTLLEIAGTHQFNLRIQNKSAVLPITHTAPLFDSTSSFYNAHVLAAKTGFHTPAKRTLVAKASYDNIDLIAVVMRTDAPNQFVDINQLFEYGAANYSLTNLADGTVTISNHSYSDWAKPYVEGALGKGWISASTRNYTSSISKREFLSILKKAVPEKYSSQLAEQILYEGPSLYNENQNITRKEMAQIIYDFLNHLVPTHSKLLTPVVTVADLKDNSATYDEAIQFVTFTNIMNLNDQGAFLPNHSVTFENALSIISNVSTIVERFENYGRIQK